MTLKEKNSYYGKNFRRIHYFKYLSKELTKKYDTNDKKLTALDLYSIAKKQKLICSLTNRKLTRDNISLDHITPLSKGGTNDISNLRFVDFNANVAKHTMSDQELLQLAKDIVNKNS